MLLTPRLRGWVAYTTPWLVLFALYCIAFLIGDRVPIWLTLLLAGINVLPLAGLGIGVKWACTRIPLPVTGSRTGFAWTQVGLLVLYGSLAMVTTGLLYWVTWPVFADHVDADLSIGILFWQFFMASLLYSTIASAAYAAQTLSRLRAEERRAAQAQTLKAKAELQALRAQLNPHFLFNTLHSLLALVRSDSEAAEDAIEQFGDLLRYPSRLQQETLDEVVFAEEWEFARNYLALEALRLGDRLRVETMVDDEAEEVVVPAFCLQPLLENAVKHAVAPRAGGGTVRISARVVDSVFKVEVADDGPGAHPSALAQAHGLGLRLVRQRLHALYGDDAQFEIDSTPNAGFTVRFHFPARERATRLPLGV